MKLSSIVFLLALSVLPVLSAVNDNQCECVASDSTGLAITIISDVGIVKHYIGTAVLVCGNEYVIVKRSGYSSHIPKNNVFTLDILGNAQKIIDESNKRDAERKSKELKEKSKKDMGETEI